MKTGKSLIRLTVAVLALAASAGVNFGAFRVQASLYHNQGYDLTPTSSVPPQIRQNAEMRSSPLGGGQGSVSRMEFRKVSAARIGVSGA